MARANRLVISALNPRIATSTIKFNKTSFKLMFAPYLESGLLDAEDSHALPLSTRQKPVVTIITSVGIDADR